MCSVCVCLFSFALSVYLHTTNHAGPRNHIMQWNDCETSTCKDTNTHTRAWSHKLLLDNRSFSSPLVLNATAYTVYEHKHMNANTHHAVLSAPWFKSLADSEFSCFPNALLLLLCLTGAWFELGPFYILSSLSSQHTGLPEGLYDPHFTYFDCFW